MIPCSAEGISGGALAAHHQTCSGGGRVGMAYIITEACIGTKDQSCVDVCPVDCIHGTDDDEQLFIDPDECIDCSACEPACPVNAIYFEDDVPDDLKHYIQINADYYKSKA
jgi:NAD-dependent dihydropyrimidine dehydrogenase PreA subunit